MPVKHLAARHVRCAAGRKREAHSPLRGCMQVACADVVVINKCDLVGLGAVAGLEDALQGLVPGARVLRARWGQVRTQQE